MFAVRASVLLPCLLLLGEDEGCCGDPDDMIASSGILALMPRGIFEFLRSPLGWKVDSTWTTGASFPTTWLFGIPSGPQEVQAWSGCARRRSGITMKRTPILDYAVVVRRHAPPQACLCHETNLRTASIPGARTRYSRVGHHGIVIPRTIETTPRTLPRDAGGLRLRAAPYRRGEAAARQFLARFPRNSMNREPGEIFINITCTR